MNNEFKGTKGKWEYEKELWHNASYENGLWMYTKKGSICQTLCEINGSGISKQEAKANALLISKAPELLEKLKYLYAMDLLKDHEESVLRLIQEATTLK